MAENVIIVKKIKKGGAAAHGGAWKVAYADFVTAMMAFFLLLWLLNSVTQEQLEGISNYFAPVAISASTSGAGAMFGGQTIGEEGSQQSRRTKPSVSVALPPPKLGKGGDGAAGDEVSKSAEDVSEEEARKKVEAAEDQQFESAEKAIREAIEAIPALQKLGESLLIDRTEEGLRIQIVDQEGLAMFPSGRSEMFEHTYELLGAVAKVINKMPQKLSISGHTDATKFVSNNGYSNWELSADRANASRRALENLGVDDGRISRVVGKAAEEPLLVDNPTSPKNRRLEIILLKNSGKMGSAIDAKDIVGEKPADIEKMMKQRLGDESPQTPLPPRNERSSSAGKSGNLPPTKPINPRFLDDESLDLTRPARAPLPGSSTTRGRTPDDESLDLNRANQSLTKPTESFATPPVSAPIPSKLLDDESLDLKRSAPGSTSQLPKLPAPSQPVRSKGTNFLDDESLDLKR